MKIEGPLNGPVTDQEPYENPITETNHSTSEHHHDMAGEEEDKSTILEAKTPLSFKEALEKVREEKHRKLI